MGTATGSSALDFKKLLPVTLFPNVDAANPKPITNIGGMLNEGNYSRKMRIEDAINQKPYGMTIKYDIKGGDNFSISHDTLLEALGDEGDLRFVVEVLLDMRFALKKTKPGEPSIKPIEFDMGTSDLFGRSKLNDETINDFLEDLGTIRLTVDYTNTVTKGIMSLELVVPIDNDGIKDDWPLATVELSGDLVHPPIIINISQDDFRKYILPTYPFYITAVNANLDIPAESNGGVMSLVVPDGAIEMTVSARAAAKLDYTLQF
jgi:hypothetical protein